MPTLLDLPPELLIDVLARLPFRPILDVSLVSRFLNSLVRNSHLLQYRLACDHAGVIDNTSCALSIPEKLQQLRTRESAFRHLDVGGARRILVPHTTSNIYDLTNGIYLLGEASNPEAVASHTKALHYVPLTGPLSEHGSPWTTINIDAEIIDLGLNVREHDLAAIVTIGRQRGLRPISLRLTQFSTGCLHPAATHPVLDVCRVLTPAAHGLPSIALEIVGEYLVLLLTMPFGGPDQPDRLFVYEWRAGRLVYTRAEEWATLASFTFLSPNVLLLLNARSHCLELCRLEHMKPSECGRARKLPRLLALDLPPITNNMQLYRASCRSEPNPTGPRSLWASRDCSSVTTPGLHWEAETPFYESPEHAIVLFNLNLQMEHFPLTPTSLAFVAHRASFLSLLSSTPRYGNAQAARTLHWEEWGPSRTRWFDTDVNPSRWITTSCGQRMVTIDECGSRLGLPLDEGGTELPARITMYDFNAANVRKAAWADREAKAQRRQAGKPMSLKEAEAEADSYAYGLEIGQPGTCVVTEESVLVIPSVFSCDVRSSLPYVKVTSEEEYSYGSVLMDGDKLVGLEIDDQTDEVLAIEVLTMAG